MNRMRATVLGSVTHDRTHCRTQRRTGPALLVALFALVLLALACDSGTQEPAAPAAEATPDSEAAPDSAATEKSTGGAPAAVAREGEIDSARFPTDLPEGVTAAVPENFPSDIPIYPGAQAAQGKGVEIEGSPQSAVQFLTNDALGDVHKFYTTELGSKGWTLDLDEENEGAATIQATKDNCKTNILITPAEGGGSDLFIVSEC
jgi:hypothetical protein